MKTIISRTWTEDHPARYGAPGGTDRMAVRITEEEICGRTYQNETVWANGVLVVAAQYPAGTDYAKRRVEKWAA